MHGGNLLWRTWGVRPALAAGAQTGLLQAFPDGGQPLRPFRMDAGFVPQKQGIRDQDGHGVLRWARIVAARRSIVTIAGARRPGQSGRPVRGEENDSVRPDSCNRMTVAVG